MSASQNPTFTHLRSENSLTTEMAQSPDHTQPFDLSPPVFLDQFGREIAPIRNGGVELLEHKYPGLPPKQPLQHSSPRFDPHHMLWWSQWEIVFAKTEMGMSDAEICLLFRYRWRQKDPSTKYMQEHHVPEILAMLDEGNKLHGYELHAHAFKYRNAPADEIAKIRDEFAGNLGTAKMLESASWSLQ